MGRPSLTPQIEERIVAALAENPTAHIVLPKRAYRADGSILVHRDNLYGVRAQRHLWRRIIGPLPRAMFLRRTCDDRLCINPHHYQAVASSRARSTHCRNGHEYTAENTLLDGRYRCRICWERLVASRRKSSPNPNPAEVNRLKTHCTKGHPFTADNTYITTTPNGRIRRRCRQCAIDYALAWREKQQAERRAERKIA